MKRILIADDHQENLYFLEVLLKAHGFLVDQAENGAQALELAKAHHPDLIISDILMPVMDGYALCSKLKADPLLQDIPLIFYTATFTTAQDEALALSLGADRFVIKPQEPDALVQIINQALATPAHAAAAGVEIITEYSEALFRKLEKKMMDLERANRELADTNAELRKAREDAACAELAKLRFLRNMSHELRTPLNVILGALQLAELDQVFDREICGQAKSALFSMLEMIDNILEASRIASAEHVVNQAPVALQQLLVQLERLFAVAVKNKGLLLRISINDALPREILTDGLHLQQVLVHLLSNAIKFTRQGTVELRLDYDAGLQPERQLLLIEVQDSGIGIDPDKQRRVFELFSQADDSDTRPFGGSGLGLYLTKRLVELMGGTISLKSEPGKGSTFSVRLPLTPAGES